MALMADELMASVHAGTRWAHERDIPDPVRWTDLAHAGAETVAVIQSRLRGGIAPAQSHTMPLPKGGGPELRLMTVADPFDEVVFRALVGRVAQVIDRSLGEEVDSYRLVEPGPGWMVRDYRYANGLRMSQLREKVTQADFAGLGTMDVRHYYPSIDAHRLGDVLLKLGADPFDVAAIRDYLLGWEELWGVHGVPVGPEASGLLGNVYLVSVDRALRGAGVRFSRYTDDYRLWLAGPDQWEDARDIVIAGVVALGLEVNPSKTRHMRTPHGVLGQLTNPDFEVLRKLLADDRHQGLAAVADAFDAEAAKPYPNPKRMGWLLRQFKVNHDAHAGTVAQQHPGLLQSAPTHWASYLKVLHGHGLVDLDWLLETATAPVTKETAAVAYHLMDVCTAKRVGASHGRKLRDFATAADRSWVPVRCAAAEAWARSDGWKPTQAAEAVLSLGDNQQRRALTLTVRHNPDGRQVAKALVKIRRTVPECRPAVKWIEDRAFEAA